MSLHVESAGVLAAQPLVLLHGWGLHGGLFAPLLPSLVERHRVHVVDLPGHGHSGAVEARSLDDHVDRVLDTLDLLDLGRTRLLGWSFGGLVAQALAARVPARVDALVLVASTPRFVSGADWPCGVEASVLRRFGDELRVAWEPTVRRFLTLQMHGADAMRPVLNTLRALASSRPPATRAALASALEVIVGSDLRARAAGLAMPSLVVSGGRDVLAPADAGAWLTATMPRAAFARIDAAAHIPFLSHRADFMASFDRFMATLDD